MKRAKKEKPELKLNLACGDHKVEGFLGVDCRTAEATEKLCDLKCYPWPWRAGSVSVIECNYFFNYLDGPERIKFMNECYRVLKDEGKLAIKVPHWSSMRSISDPYVAWPPLCEVSFVCFNKEWRIKNKQDHYPIRCDFDFGYGYVLAPELHARNDAFKQDAVKDHNNAVLDIIINMTKRPG